MYNQKKKVKLVQSGFVEEIFLNFFPVIWMLWWMRNESGGLEEG